MNFSLLNQAAGGSPSHTLKDVGFPPLFVKDLVLTNQILYEYFRVTFVFYSSALLSSFSIDFCMNKLKLYNESFGIIRLVTVKRSQVGNPSLKLKITRSEKC